LAGQVAILADDLTGALDAAAGFASSTSPVQAVWASRDIRDGVGFSIDSETRDVPASEAEAKVADLLPRLLAGGIRYKKIDSLLRGNTVAEIAVCGTNRAFGSLVIAPAFPAQNRITRGGRQYARLSGRWGRVGPSIGDELRTRAVPSRLIARGIRPSGGGVLLCDAESEQDLTTIAASTADLDRPILWCGSAGLARGLAGLRSPAILPPAASALALIGSRHPMSVRQVRHLAEAFPEAVVTLDSLAGARAAVASLAARLQKHGRAALAFELPVLARNAVNALLNTVFAAIVRAIDPPGRVIIGGGDTLMRLAAAAGAARLETVGEWRAGIPLSYFPNGRWQGTAVLSKSGAFGDERTLTEALGLVESRVP
jgi:uncharacterized protein YgbK (DUF1537 family)